MRDCAPFRRFGLMLLALLALAFATGARAAPDPAELRLEAYLLSGGSAADLCAQDGTDPAHAASCSLCHLIASSTLPDGGPSLVAVELHVVATVLLPQLRRAAMRLRDPATPPTGPPAT
ncbi:hypothetical protein D2T31_09420 [Sinirhodobacter populi]|uniref:DUF2946 domain-containing protein n=1 Tax=Paenirhodobacter populi TaxID=2306993 RepID=A0A443KAI2_9RHOB|nr:hypothetical protein [Sinirhodobacter populi]RWR29653.1 hypothetical protein D2T31_09420 [Sinirhodobacter populi]